MWGLQKQIEHLCKQKVLLLDALQEILELPEDAVKNAKHIADRAIKNDFKRNLEFYNP